MASTKGPGKVVGEGKVQMKRKAVLLNPSSFFFKTIIISGSRLNEVCNWLRNIMWMDSWSVFSNVTDLLLVPVTEMALLYRRRLPLPVLMVLHSEPQIERIPIHHLQRPPLPREIFNISNISNNNNNNNRISLIILNNKTFTSKYLVVVQRSILWNHLALCLADLLVAVVELAEMGLAAGMGRLSSAAEGQIIILVV